MNTYHIYKDNMIVGPLSEEDMQTMLDQQSISQDTLCCKYPEGEWKPISDVFGSQSVNVLPLPGQDEVAEDAQAVFICQNSDEESVFACPFCQQYYTLSFNAYAGKSITCQNCQGVFTIPLQFPQEEIDQNPQTEEPLWEDIAQTNFDGNLTCPHCWQKFSDEDLLYIAVHPSLVGDSVLGDFAQTRFRPSTFNAQGLPIDDCGLPATDAACPRCHLEYPLGMVDNPSLYFSIAGATSSGKSYFLTGLIHQLRKLLPQTFNAGFYDLSPKLNETLSNYEKQLYMSLEPDKITALPATQISGEGISDRVLLDNVEIELPKPFIYTCRPCQQDGSIEETNFVFYDNSGELFIPGRDEWVNQATRHLAFSNGIMFIFDPTNDANMCQDICDQADPQVSKRPRAVDQVILFNEMINRIRRHSNLKDDEICQIPLIVVIGKYDTWQGKFDKNLRQMNPIITNPDTFASTIDMDMIADVSFSARQMLMHYVPSLVDIAERFFSSVFFVPVSTFGRIAEMSASGFIGIVPKKISPIWLEVPVLTLLYQNNYLKEGASPVRTQPGEQNFQAKIINNQIVFRHPVTNEIIRLPENYGGRRLVINGKSYDLPAIHSRHFEQTSSNPWK